MYENSGYISERNIANFLGYDIINIENITNVLSRRNKDE